MVVFPQAGGTQDWVRNVAKNPHVGVFGGNNRWEGRARLAAATDLKSPVLGAFLRKYGEAEVKKRYWGQMQYVEIELLSKNEEDFRELVYADLEVAFDGVAETYDGHIMGNPMNLWLRNRSVNLLTKLFRPGEVLLEVGCGTGTETLSLARAGIRVVASDISSRMLEVMMAKARAAGLQDMIVPLHCRPYELFERVTAAGYGSVDGAYSTYGAVNTEPRLDTMLSNLHDLIVAEGRLVLGVWNRYCMYEIMGYAFRARPEMVVARLRNPVPVGKSRFCVATNSFSVSSLGKLAKRWFEQESLRGVGIILPPSNLTRYLPPVRLLGLARRADAALETIFPWNRFGDHFLGVYRRVA